MTKKLLLLNKKSQGLRGLLIVIFIAISTFSFSQSFTNSDFNQVNNIRYGLFNICDSIWLTEPTRKSPVDAFEDLNVYKANHPDDDCMQITAKGMARLDISNKWKNQKTIDTVFNCPPILTFKIDTIEKVVHNYGNVKANTKAVFDDCIQKYIVAKDSIQIIPNYSFTAKMERETSWIEAKTSYRLISTPFFFYKSDSVYATSDPTVMKARTFANKMHCIRHFVNGVEIQGAALFNSIACNPGSSTFAGGSFRHTNTFNGLDRSIDNVIRLEALDVDTGKVIGSREFVILKL